MNIHLHRTTEQDPSSDDFAVTETMLRYYDISYANSALALYLHRHRYGSLITEIADCLRQHQLQTTLVTSNPQAFSPNAWKKFHKLHDEELEDQVGKGNEFSRLMKKGTYILEEVPSAQLIQKELKAERPVIISYDPRLLYQHPGAVFNYSIISGFDEETFTVVDFSPHHHAKKLPKEAVMLAILHDSESSPTAGCILFIKKKELES